MSTMHQSSPALRRALLIDAGASAALGLLLVIAAGRLSPLLGLPEALLRGVGIFLIPFALSLLALAPRAAAHPSLVRLVVVGNLGWIVASVLLLVVGVVSPTLLGQLFVLAQAAAVALFTHLEHAALGRSAVRTTLQSAR